MKKLLALLLAALMCLSLVACSNNSKLKKYEKYETLINYMEAEDYENALAEMIKLSGNADAQGDNEQEDSKQEDTQQGESEQTAHTVEITLDNWQEYFEFRPDVSVLKNSYNEITGMYVTLKFFPKEAIAENITVPDAWDDDRIVFDVQYIDPYACVYSYDLNTQKLTIGEYTEGSSTYSADDLLPSEDRSGTYDSGNDAGYFPMDGYWVIASPLNKEMDCTIKDNTVESYGFAYSSIEITRIKGTITILK